MISFFFFKQKTAYEMRISDWSSDVCSSDLDDWFRIVVNAATRDKDMAWIERQAAAFDIEVRERSDLSMVAVQGPNARDKALGLIAEDDRARVGKLGKFAGIEAKAADGASLFVARTGYTGEDGFEIVLPQDRAVALWDALL